MSRYNQTSAKRTAHPNTSRERKRQGIRPVTVMVLMVLSACGGFYLAKFAEKYELAPEAYQWLSNILPTHSSLNGNSPQAETPLPDSGSAILPINPPDEVVVLPVLDKSDTWIRQSLISLSPGLAKWLNKEQLIRTYLTIAVDASQNTRLNKHVHFLKPDQAFAVAEDSQGLFIAEESYRRYTPLSAAINALNVADSLIVYKKIRPLLQQAFAEFNPPKTVSLEAMLIQSAEQIMAVPTTDKRVYLEKRTGYYRLADPKLEAASPLYKQMLRMGSENTQIIQNKLRSLIDALKQIEG